MENSTSIYAKQHPKIRQILEGAGNPRKALCVALDYAKAQHVALICDGLGDILKKCFAVENSPAGLEQLIQEVQSTCRHRHIKRKHVFFGGEDNPPYVQNFVAGLAQQGYVVARVNAWEAKHQRDNQQASTDELDVRAIAKTLLHKASYCDQDRPQMIDALKELSRTRHALSTQLTEQKLQIHHYVNRLFPQFLSQKKSGIAPFSEASLALMAEDFCAERLRRQRGRTVVSFLQRHGQTDPEAAATQLQSLAGQVFNCSAAIQSCWQASLSVYVRQFQSLSQSLQLLEKQLAGALAKTPGALLTSIQGIGVVLASGIVAELGEPSQWSGVDSLCSYAGVVPRVFQTGGPDSPAQTSTVQRRCNRRAKNWIVQAATKMGECGPVELKEQFEKLDANGQHAQFIMAKRLLRIAKDVMRRSAVYRPKALLDPDTPAEQLRSYYLQLWDRLLDKWAGLIGWEELFDRQNPLGQWRQMAQELYQLSLPLPKARRRKAT